jgi:hypothetical protein
MLKLTTNEIREFLCKACMDFEIIQNKALNEYLAKVFHTCPFKHELCTKKEPCNDCDIFKNQINL